MIDVVNLQRKVELDLRLIRAFVADLPAHIEEAAGSTFSVAFVSDDRMWKLNWSFRGKDSTTDVLSFPNEPDEFEGQINELNHIADGTSEGANPPFLGDIVISADQASRQADENDLSLDDEIKQLILHGLLHLCGYDHENDDGEMDRRELGLRKLLSI